MVRYMYMHFVRELFMCGGGSWTSRCIINIQRCCKYLQVQLSLTLNFMNVVVVCLTSVNYGFHFLLHTRDLTFLWRCTVRVHYLAIQLLCLWKQLWSCCKDCLLLLDYSFPVSNLAFKFDIVRLWRLCTLLYKKYDGSWTFGHFALCIPMGYWKKYSL